MFETIGIIGGTGTLGTMFSEALEKLGKVVIRSNSRTVHMEEEMVRESDLIIVIVPMHKSGAVFSRIRPFLRPDHMLVDFNSVKLTISKDLEAMPCEVVSCHPLFGKVSSIEEQNILTIPINAPKGYEALKDLWKAIGLKVSEVSTLEEHDELMSYIQGLMHFLHISFAQTLRVKGIDVEKLLEICSPVYRSYFAFSSRILTRDVELYTNILLDNPTNRKVIRDFMEQSENLLGMVEGAKEDDFKKGFLESRDYLGESGIELSRESDHLVDAMKGYMHNFINKDHKED